MLKSQFLLFKDKRFLPLFIAQITMAFHDNLFKNVLIVFIVYKVGNFSVQNSTLMVTLAAGIFILPFIVFSAFGAVLADRFGKPNVIRSLKLFEFFIAFMGAASILTQSIVWSFCTLFLLGTQTALFGPSKFSILPEILHEHELISGNALLNSGTFIAIIIGMMVGAGFASAGPIGGKILVGIIFSCALAGWIASWFVQGKICNKKGALSFNILRQTKDALLNLSQKPYQIILPVLGVSWFYFLAGMFMTQIPNYTKEVLHADVSVLTFFLIIFSIAIGLGGLLNNTLLQKRIAPTYVPLAALGIAILTIDLYFASPTSAYVPAHMHRLGTFLAAIPNWRIICDLFLIAVLCGLFVVPLLALIQHRTTESERTHVIAGAGILDAIFIVISTALSALLLWLGLSIEELFLTYALLHLIVATCICALLPDLFFKSILQFFLKVFYRVDIKGLENIEKAGGRAVIIANHCSYLDAPLLAAFLPQHPVFAIDKEIAGSFWLRPILKHTDTFALDPIKPYALKTIIHEVKKNRHAVIFPEGRLTETGSLMKIYEGAGMIAEKADATIVPIRIDGPQYTPFARLKGKVPRRFFPKIKITISEPQKIPISAKLTGRARRKEFSRYLHDVMEDTLFITEIQAVTLFQGLLHASTKNGSQTKIVEDIERKPLKYKDILRRSVLLGKKFLDETTLRENVGVLLPNGGGITSVFFALQAIGRVPALLNFTSGPHAVLSCCHAAGIKIVYTSRRFVELAKLEGLVRQLESHLKVIFLEDLRSKITLLDKLAVLMTSPKKFHRRFSVSAEDPAVVLFTSGSEGAPKGVVLSHRNLMSNITQLSCRVDFNQKDLLFNALPLFHSFGLTGGMLLPVLSGVKTFLYVSPLHYRTVPELVYGLNATIMFGTDTFLKGYARVAHPYDFYKMRYIFAGAEKIQDDTRRIYMERFGVRVLEGYGTTETSPVIAVNSPLFSKPGSVGRFLTNIEYKLSSIEGISEGGRLNVKGPNVMLGYYLASQPAVIQPPHGGWHDTGDIVRVDEEGFIFILGRAKRFAKIAGEMISLTAVEVMVQARWAGDQHAILSIIDEQKGEKLVLVTTKLNPNRSDLVDYVRENGLSPLNIPAIILTIDKIPVLGTGKTDYVALQNYIEEKISKK